MGSFQKEATMTKGWDGSGAHQGHPQPEHDLNEPKIPYKTVRPKRRRKGQLNDGQWAPGNGSDAKIKPK
jgi:hypothetical protein